MALVDLEMQDVFYPAKEYIETQAGNKVSRDSVLCGPQNVVLNGKTIIQVSKRLSHNFCRPCAAVGLNSPAARAANVDAAAARFFWNCIWY